MLFREIRHHRQNCVLIGLRFVHNVILTAIPIVIGILSQKRTLIFLGIPSVRPFVIGILESGKIVNDPLLFNFELIHIFLSFNLGNIRSDLI